MVCRSPFSKICLTKALGKGTLPVGSRIWARGKTEFWGSAVQAREFKADPNSFAVMSTIGSPARDNGSGP